MAIQIGQSTPTLTRATPGTASATVLAANPARGGAVIKNFGSATVFLNFGAAATTATFPLAQNESLELAGYTGSVTGITASGTGDLRCVETVPV